MHDRCTVELNQKMIRLDCAFFICMKAIKGGLQVTEQKKLIVPNEEEKIIQIEIERLTTFKDHPFKVQEDEDMKMLKEYNISMGMMLESSSERLMSTVAHEKSPGKNPKIRLETIENAGKLNIAYTTGILIGIGETKEEIADSLLKIKELCDKYGHIQEVIIQNFTVSPGIEMENYEEPSLLDMVRTVAAAQLLFDEDVSVQVPPNLNYETSQIFLLCGTDDWGGVSPLSEDYVNPSSPWPTLEKLEKLTNDAGYELKERLAIYEKYINEKYIENPVLLEKTKRAQEEIENN